MNGFLEVYSSPFTVPRPVTLLFNVWSKHMLAIHSHPIHFHTRMLSDKGVEVYRFEYNGNYWHESESVNLFFLEYAVFVCFNLLNIFTILTITSYNCYTSSVCLLREEAAACSWFEMLARHI